MSPNGATVEVSDDAVERLKDRGFVEAEAPAETQTPKRSVKGKG